MNTLIQYNVYQAFSAFSLPLFGQIESVFDKGAWGVGVKIYKMLNILQNITFDCLKIDISLIQIDLNPKHMSLGL